MIERKKSIRFKLTRVIVITSSSVLLLTFAFFFLYEFLSYRQITERQLMTISSILASNSTAALAFDSQEDAHEILTALKSTQNIAAACLYDKNGQIFTFYPDSASNKDFPLLPGPDGFSISLKYIEGFGPVQQGQLRVGTLFIKRDLTDLYERLLIYTIIAALIMSGSFALVLLLSKRLQKRIAAPIIALSETSTQISLNHNYSIRAQKQSEDELGSLTDAFNNMLTQIEIQTIEIEAARQKAYRYSQELEVMVNERTAEYRKQKDFAEIVINSSLVLIAVFDTDTKIIGFNKKCEEEFGLSREQVIGKKFAEALPGVRNTTTYTNVERALKGETIHNPQYKSGVTGKYYESYVIPLRNEKDEIYAVLMTAHNITQIVESTEKISNKNVELQNTNEALEQFAYVASHDLQEPLRKIKIFIKMVKDNISDSPMAEKYIGKVENSATRMASLIKDVLEYSRLSQVQESFTEVDLNEIVENVKLDFELLISERRAIISKQVLPTIQGNKLQIHQLFANLISNSIKFCETDPMIGISGKVLASQEIIRRNLTDNINPRHQYIELIFSDNGIGFESQYADKIFSIFQRLNSREKYEGTGIGLALCKKIVQNHNGHISVTSEPGKGTTFSIILPTAPSQL